MLPIENAVTVKQMAVLAQCLLKDSANRISFALHINESDLIFDEASTLCIL